jgi:hypothetical protein
MMNGSRVFLLPAMFIALACLAGLGTGGAIAGGGERAADAGPPSAGRAAEFREKVRPTLAKYCLGCHSQKEKKGELDLERFTSIEEARRDLKPWQAMVEMLESKEMPPKDKPQPTSDQRKELADWARQFVAVEARARAGDPGPAMLRRLSNAEYDEVIRALTGVNLRPAREFPADGAAGEGFTNAAAALTVSPALVDKYFVAAKGIADHAVLLPDGIRFSASPHQRDWVDEILTELHGLYGRFAESDGRLPLRRYLAATIQYREALVAGKESFAEVARREHLSAKYLQTLWGALHDGSSSSALDPIRARWKTAKAADVAAIADQIEAWQQATWTLENNAAGIYETWQKQNQPLVDSQTLRIKLNPPPGQNEVTLYLVARNVGTKDDNPLTLWESARIEDGGQPPLALRDVPLAAERAASAIREQFHDAARYLAVAAEWHRGRSSDSLESLAKQHGVNASRLGRWIEAVGLHSDVAGPLDLLDVKIAGNGGRPLVNGWGSKTPDSLPSLVTNSSDQPVAIPGTVPAHKVAVHPSPKEYAAVAWRSPNEADVRIEARAADSHAGCGNGVSWRLEAQHGDRRERLDGGEFDDGKEATIPPRTLHVAPGDLLCLAIGARNGDHTCDLTLVDLTITELSGLKRNWNLSNDVADNILDANPHADRLGNKDIWQFAKGRDTTPAGAPIKLPPGSALAHWREALDKSAPLDQLAILGERVQAVMIEPAPAAAGDPDAAMYAALSAPERGLVEPLALAKLLMNDAAATSPHSRYGVDPSRFGKSAGGERIAETSFESKAAEMIEIHLPSVLAANREFVVDVRVNSASETGGDLVQLQASTSPPAPVERVRDAPIVTGARGKRRDAQGQAIAEFRRVFPLMLCFGRIVPQDPDGITLRLFCREDEPLSRLMLDSDEQQHLDRLWRELQFVAREAEQEHESFPLFMGFASQVGLVPKFEPLREPIRIRAEQFRQELLAAEPKHVEAVLDFAARAYRRPLQEIEKQELLRLYETLRKKNVAHEEAIRALLTRVLVSSAFLFHVEPSPAGEAPQPVSDWELASRLSFFLWSSLPDDELRRIASQGKLHEPATLAAQTRRMLKDPKVRTLAIEFGAQWIGVRGFDELKEKNERRFPTFDSRLRAAIYEETILFFQDLFQNDEPLSRVLDADYAFLNKTLAKHYGIPGVAGLEWRRVEGVKKYGRGGILGLASIQATQAGASRTSPVLRGNWVVETLLGERLPRPPPNVPKLPEEETGNDGLSMRQLVEKHTHLAECAVCHQRIDPFGFSLEKYDAIGRLREKDLGGATVDSKVKLKDGTEFDGLGGLREYLLTKKRDIVVRLFCRRLLGYALGRATTPADQPTTDAMIAAMNKNDGHLSAAVLAIVESPQFRLIRGGQFTGSD